MHRYDRYRTVTPHDIVVSRYNFAIPTSDGAIVYNASTGVAIRFAGTDARQIARLLTHSRHVDPASFDDATLRHLRTNGFLVDFDVDEVAIVRRKYWAARGDTPLTLTLTTTQDCNLGCYYCYEERSVECLTTADIPWLLDRTSTALAEAGGSGLHVDWYGGEPLLNIDFIEAASPDLQTLCMNHGVSYSASIISNGSLWPDDSEAFIRRHRIRQAQISFDGLKGNHEKRRRVRRGYLSATRKSTFDAAVFLVDHLVRCVRVDLRYNIDYGNITDVIPFIEMAKARGWFSSDFPATLQLARISNYSARSEFMRAHELDQATFENIRAQVRKVIPAEERLDEVTSRKFFPYPRSSVCAALAPHSVVIGADRNEYRCGLQVGEANRAVGYRNVDGALTRGPDAQWWENFDPTIRPRCSQCSFLPVCWGGCPKKHLEGDTVALEEQGAYWRQALPQKIAYQFGADLPDDFTFSEQDQFR